MILPEKVDLNRITKSCCYCFYLHPSIAVLNFLNRLS